ncbi:MAG TPA: hypothetical protein VIL35_00775 [Vicinamibacterales bacterium]
MSDRETSLPERSFYLLLLAGAPTVFMLHFLATYIAAAVWCARFVPRDGSLSGIRVAEAGLTLVALGCIAAIGWSGYRRHSYGSEALPHDMDTPEDRHRFLGFSTLLLAGLSAIATIFVAISTVMFQTCH